MSPLLVVAGLIFHRGKLLITQRPEGSKHAGFWEFPGGKLEKDEDPISALRRELREEIALEVDEVAAFDIIYHRYDERPVLLMIYRCLSHTDVVHHREVSDHAWVTIDQLDDYPMLPADQEFISSLPQKLTPA
jgi:8-oxo-dGTP diphosphatase